MKDRETKDLEKRLKRDGIAKAKRLAEQKHKNKKKKHFGRVPKIVRTIRTEAI